LHFCHRAVICPSAHGQNGIAAFDRSTGGGDFSMTSRADVVGSTGGEVSKGASGQDIALRFYRAVMLVSIVLIVLSVM